MQADEVDNVAARLTPEAGETLPLKVDEEAWSPIVMEWTATLVAMRAGPLQLHSSSLHNLDQPISEFDVGNIPVAIVRGGCHDRPANVREPLFAE